MPASWSPLPIVFALLLAPAVAAPTQPEIRRPPAPAQAVGRVHTLRVIPEACARLEGVFTGESAQPYRFAAVRSSPACQPRARFVDAARARLDADAGWKLNDVIRVPNAACPGQQVVVRIWRKPGTAAPPAHDAQGRARIYLQDAVAQARTEGAVGVTSYAASMTLAGPTCD